MFKITSIITMIFLFNNAAISQVVTVKETKKYNLNLVSDNKICCGYNNAGVIEIKLTAPEGCTFGYGGIIGADGKWSARPTDGNHIFWSGVQHLDGGRTITTTDAANHWEMQGYPTWKTYFFYSMGSGPSLHYVGPVQCNADYAKGHRMFYGWVRYYQNSLDSTINEVFFNVSNLSREIESNVPHTFSCNLPDTIDMGTSGPGIRNVKKMGINCQDGAVLSINGSPYQSGRVISGETERGLRWEINPDRDEIAVTSDPEYSGNYNFQLAVKWAIP